MTIFSSRAIGLDISDHSIEAIELDRTSENHYRLIADRRIKIPEGIVEDGIIIDSGKLTTALSELITSPGKGKFSTHNVNLALPESRTMRYIFSFPEKMSEEELRTALPGEAEKVIPFDIGTSPWGYERVGTERGKQIVLYAVAPERLCREYIDVITSAKLTPAVFELESNALVRAFSNSYTGAGISVILDIGARTTTITVRDTLGIRFTHSVPVAGNHFTQSIADRLHLTFAEASNKKMSAGLSLKTLRAAITPLIKRILTEADKAVTFVERKTGKTLSDVILCGGSASLPGLVEYVQEEVEGTVRIGDPWKQIKTRADHAKEVHFATAIGLGMRGADPTAFEKSINLLPKT